MGTKVYKVINLELAKNENNELEIYTKQQNYHFNRYVGKPTKLLSEIINEVRKDEYDNIILDILSINRKRDLSNHFNVLTLFKPGEILQSLI